MAVGPIQIPDFDLPANDQPGLEPRVSNQDRRIYTGGGRQPPSPPPPPPNPRASERKFRAKRVNEHIKSLYALANTLAAAIIGTAYILPTIKNDCGPNELDRPGWVVVGLVLHAFGQVVIWAGTQKEE